MEKSKSQLPEKNSDFIWVEAPEIWMKSRDTKI